MLEKAHVFNSRGQQLVAIEHIPVISPELAHVNRTTNKGIIIVVGGPQTRVGSHRLFVHLARELAKQGIHVYRFDYTGAGDSEGEITEFTDIQADIAAAVEHFQQLQPQITKLTLWGLCDAASAILLYLAQSLPAPLAESLIEPPQINTTDNVNDNTNGTIKDNLQNSLEINGIMLVNPWVRQVHTQAKAYLKSYYMKRIFSRQFWMKLFSGKVDTSTSFKDLRGFHQQSKQTFNQKNFVDQMWQGLSNFQGKSHIVLSGNDLVADEFSLLINSCNDWQQLMVDKVNSTQTIQCANHTFSAAQSQRLLFEKTLAVLLAK